MQKYRQRRYNKFSENTKHIHKIKRECEYKTFRASFHGEETLKLTIEKNQQRWGDCIRKQREQKKHLI